jgi:diacylglycerol O-acyltransferase
VTDAPSVDRMSDTDALAWAIEHDPRLRSPISAIVILDGPVDHTRLRHVLERASRVVPRMRHRVIPDPTGLAPPTWEVDPDFTLAFHVRLTNIYDGTERDLLELAEPIVLQAFDRARPQWEFTIVDGLRGDRSALIMKAHHAISDGVGAVNMMLEVFDLQPELTRGRENLPPAPEPDPAPTESRLRAAVDHEAQELVNSVRRSLETAVGAVADPVGALQSVSETITSASRILRPAAEPLSPIMTGRSLSVGFADHTVPLAGLRDAGRRIGGSINDAFVAAVLLGVGGYHRQHGHDIDRIRMAIPINTRAPDDDSVGNNWTPSRAEMPLDVLDPDELMRRVRGTVARLRTEPAYGILAAMTGTLRRLPASVIAAVFATMSGGVDVAASNVPGSPVPVYLAGRRVEKLIPLGPLSGAGSNITLISLADRAHIGIVRDPAAVPDGESFAEHLRDGFERVTAG